MPAYAAAPTSNAGIATVALPLRDDGLVMLRVNETSPGKAKPADFLTSSVNFVATFPDREGKKKHVIVRVSEIPRL